MMNKIKFLSIVFLLLNLVSCNVEPLDPAIIIDVNNNGNETGNFTATIDTDGFVAQQVVATYSNSANGTVLNISGVASNGKSIAIQMENPVFGSRDANTVPSTLLRFQYGESSNDIYSSVNNTTNTSTGSITITQFNLATNKISGTFNFKGYGAINSALQKIITEGVFTDITFVNTVNNNTNVTLPGSYLLTAFNTSVPTDLNGDGTNSTNQLSETSCLNGSFLTINANNTFTADSKGIEININGTQIDCFEDPDITGTWTLNGSQLSLSYVDLGTPYTDVFTVSGNTLTYTVQDGEVVGSANGNPVYLTSDITFIYTKQ
jgi:hypothetical protein